MLRVLIVDDPAISYRSFRDLSSKEEDMRVVSITHSSEEARLHLRHSDVILVGSALPEATALVEEINANHPHLKVLVSGIEEEATQILNYVEAGAAGYLVGEETPERMLQKVRATAEGEALVSRSVAASLISRVATLANHTPAAVHHSLSHVNCEELTPRQNEVLSLIHDERLSNQEIANRLHIEVGTVKNHVHHILKKLGLHDRYEAAAAYGRWLQKEGARQAYVTL